MRGTHIRFEERRGRCRVRFARKDGVIVQCSGLVWYRCSACAGFWKETGTSSWAAPMQWWWFFIRPVLQLSLGHCSWKAGLQTLFPPLLPSEIYIYIFLRYIYIFFLRYIFLINVYSLVYLLWQAPKGPDGHSRLNPKVLYCSSPRMLRNIPPRA